MDYLPGFYSEFVNSKEEFVWVQTIEVENKCSTQFQPQNQWVVLDSLGQHSILSNFD
jgi:hypothetical protein